MDYSLIVGLLALLVAVATLLDARERTKLMKQNLSAHRRAAANQRPWWRTPPVIAVAFFAALTWVPWVYGLAYPPAEIAFNQFSEGLLPNGDLYIDADLRNDKPDKKVIAVAFRKDPRVNDNDATGLIKSTPYDYIRGPGHFVIPVTEEFKKAVPRTPTIMISFLLLEVPNTVMPDQFSTLAEAYRLGAKSILVGSR